MQKYLCVLVTFGDNEAAAGGPLRANEREKKRSDDSPCPCGLLCLHFTTLARRAEGLKGQKYSTSGTTMEALTLQTKKKKKRKKKISNL